MLASDSQLMPDPPDKGRPSSAPLSAEDADRLADSFTPFWEDADVPAAPEPVATATAETGSLTAPMPAVEPVRQPVGKQTLLGIAPINIEKPASAPPPAAIPAPTTPVAALTTPVAALTTPVAALTTPVAAPTTPVPAPTTPVAHTQPLLAVAAAPSPIEKPAASEPIQSSPEVPGYAIAYIPKDPPSTPAVVIAPEAQSSPQHQPPPKKREFSQTIPSRVRSAPNASVAPLPPPAPHDDFNPYAPKKANRKIIGLGLGGALLVVAGTLGIRTLSIGSQALPAEATARRTDVVPAATAVAAAPTLAPAETAEPIPKSAQSSAAAAAPAAVGRASEPPPAKAKAKAKANSAAAAARPVTRAPAPAPEPSPSPVKPVSKGIIVRDAPF